MTPTPREEELRIRLRAAADEHRPDREAMLARIDRRRAEGTAGRSAFRAERSGGRRRAGGIGGFRPIAAAAALAGVVTLGVGGTWLFVGFGQSEQPDAASAPPPPPVAAVTPTTAATTPEPAPTTSSPTPSAASPSARSTSPSKSSTSPRTSQAPIPDGNARERGWLWSNGALDPNSNANWSQSTVTLKNKSEITALDVTIRVAVTSGLKTTGNWSSVPNDKLESEVREDAGWLYYRFRLRDGATMAPGSYVFAGQYNHGGRSTGKDAYVASASAGKSDVQVHGGF
ncbi:hypothetical protein [Cryptosporangium sp. NPDC048952]|uniref:hypothetical protein n=1 Tax=Cryptosporangium sp. NPDC048952 TaxID=3363961 RepID=UPI003717257D